MNLVIVESPTKARTIGRFLGKEYTILASMGHLMDLPKSKLGVDVEKKFAPDFQLMEAKKDTINDLKKAYKSAQNVILATDPDREGEAIAAHIVQLIANSKWQMDGKKKSNNHMPSAIIHKPIQRIVFHEITKEAIEEALQHPRSIDEHLVDAQTARRVLDRLVGYKLSPMLWRKVRRGLSAGRVQSVAVRLIVEREREIEKFKKEPYFTIVAKLQRSKASESVDFELIEIKGEKIEIQRSYQLYDGEYTVTKTTIEKEESAKQIVDNLETKKFIVADVIQKEMRRSPAPPYTTSTLQQDASRRLGLTSKRTMSIAQKLYEEGYITYHRTDSVVMADSAKQNIISFIRKEYGEKYLPEKPRFYKTKQKLAQEAHEAIRPTKVSLQPSAISSQLGQGYERVYEMIWRRAVASQMADAVTESTAVLVDATAGPATPSEYRFKANGSVLVFDGFLKVNPQALQDNRLPMFEVNEELKLVNAQSEFHETQPPPRYNDASLIKTLEEKGIGRPSTYAPIISTIEDRRYVEKEQARFKPTPIGVAVNDFLVKNFSDIDDVPFTAEMEDSLDLVAKGEKDWVVMMEAFYTPFSKKLDSMKDVERVKIEVEKTDQKCEKCGSPLVIRTGRFGKFLSCSRFPDCDFKKSLVEETNLTCPKDGGKIIVKRTRKGYRFYGCSNYPKCDFAAWKLEDITGNSKLNPSAPFDTTQDKSLRARTQNSKVQVKN